MLPMGPDCTLSYTFSYVQVFGKARYTEISHPFFHLWESLLPCQKKKKKKKKWCTGAWQLLCASILGINHQSLVVVKPFTNYTFRGLCEKGQLPYKGHFSLLCVTNYTFTVRFVRERLQWTLFTSLCYIPVIVV